MVNMHKVFSIRYSVLMEEENAPANECATMKVIQPDSVPMVSDQVHP